MELTYAFSLTCIFELFVTSADLDWCSQDSESKCMLQYWTHEKQILLIALTVILLSGLKQK